MEANAQRIRQRIRSLMYARALSLTLGRTAILHFLFVILLTVAKVAVLLALFILITTAAAVLAIQVLNVT